MASGQLPLANRRPSAYTPYGWRTTQDGPTYSRLVTSQPPLIRACFYLFVLSLPFGSLNAELNTGPFSLAKLLGYVLFASALVYPRICFRACPRPFWYFVFYFIVFACLGVLQGPEYHSATIERFEQVVQLLILYRISYNIMLDRQALNGVVIGLVVGCSVASLLAFLGVGVTTFEYAVGQRYGFLTDDPNTVGAVYGLGLIAALSLGIKATKVSRAGRTGAWIAAAVLMVATLRTASRSAAIAVVAALLCFLLSKGTFKKKLMSAVLGVIVISAVVLTGLEIPVVKYRWEETLIQGKTGQRGDLAPEAWRMFIEKPIAGWGPTANLVELGDRFGKDSKDTHNLFLWVLTETGVVGGVPYIAGFLLALSLAWRARGGSQGIVPFALMIFLFVFNLGVTWFNQKLFWVVLAYACASHRGVVNVIRRKVRRPVTASAPAEFSSLRRVEGAPV